MQRIPEQYRAYALLGRIDRPIGIWLLALPGWWAICLAADGFSFRILWLFVLFGLGAIVMRAAGCVINDIWDRDLDRRVERTSVRPLAAEDLSMWQAFKFLMILLFAGLVILMQMNAVTVILGFLSIPFIIAYPIMKRFTWWPQAFLGLTFNFGVLMGWSAMSDAVSSAAFMLYLGAIFWTLGYDTIYAHQDKEDDALAGIKSTALHFGESSKVWVGGFYALAFACMAYAFYMAGPYWLPLLLIPAGGHLAWQILRWDMDDADSSLAMFRSNRNCGSLILGAAVVSVFV